MVPLWENGKWKIQWRRIANHDSMCVFVCCVCDVMITSICSSNLPQFLFIFSYCQPAVSFVAKDQGHMRVCALVLVGCRQAEEKWANRDNGREYNLHCTALEGCNRAVP